MEIKRESTIGEVVKAYPEAAPIIMSYGLHCIGCHVAHWETLEQGCRGHGIAEEDIDELVKELNEFAKTEQEEAKKKLAAAEENKKEEKTSD